jgi:hypothetical protein
VQSDAVVAGSTYVLASSGLPTAVTLASFGAHSTSPNVPGRITLNWTTASEVNTAGFNLYRSESADGPYVRINAQLIPASVDSLVGGKYEYQDSSVSPGRTYYYQLEDVEYDGTSVRHSPVAVTAPSASGSSSAEGVLIALGFAGLVAAGVGFLILQKRSAA